MDTQKFVSTGSGNEALNGCLARTGLLHGTIPTPTLMIPAARGLPLHLIPQVMRSKLPELRTMGVHAGEMYLRKELLTEHLQNRNSSSLEGAAEKAVEPRGFFDGHDFCVHMGLRDTMKGEKETVHFTNEVGEAQDPSVMLDFTGGRQKISLNAHLETVKALQPDMFTTLSEEVTCAASVGQKRIARSVEFAERNLQMVKERIAEFGSRAPMVLANIQGGKDLSWRKIAISRSRTQDPGGYYIGGLGYGEDFCVRANILRTVSEELFQESSKPRLLCLGDGHPLEILQAVWLGMDIIECTFPLAAAESGVALLFKTRMPTSSPQPEDMEYCRKTLQTSESQTLRKPIKTVGSLKRGRRYGKVNRKHPAEEMNWGVSHVYLWDDKHAEDISQLDEESPFRQFTRAYLHHLLKCGEMLAQIILTVHNLNLYSRLFAELRIHTAAGTLHNYVRWFVETNLPAFRKL